MADVRLPNESPEYRAARDRLLAAEAALRDQVESVATLRRQLPLGGRVPEDYVFDELDAAGNLRHVKLSELFVPGKPSLFLYGYMFGPKAPQPCPMCTSFLDGLNGSAGHLTQRISMAVVARSPIGRINEIKVQRGWTNLRLLSSAGNTYQRTYFAEDEAGNQLPMLNVFVNRGGSIHHFWGSELLFGRYTGGDSRHIDMMWPLWNVFDLTPEGRGKDWYPSLNYE
jgi:predicted dithiol-disulfide oxidoreductase (DUF899 family)